LKAIALLSGGLDSSLALRVMLEQGIEIEVLNFSTIFCTCNKKGGCSHFAQKITQELGVPMKIFSLSEEYLEVVKHPRYGYGKNLNPCLDCRIFLFKKAKEYMEKAGAAFIITGEVLGQRPMSQHRQALKIIERDSGLEGLIMRPLSAKLLEPTIPEKEGWINREKLLAIAGRSRKPQIQLADKYQLHEYPCPAGGCLLTDPNFALRLKDLMDINPDFTVKDVALLKWGRYVKISKTGRLVVGRNEQENKVLEGLFFKGTIMLLSEEVPGPVAIFWGNGKEEDLTRAARITAGFSDEKSAPVNIKYCIFDTGSGETLKVLPLAPDMIHELLISHNK
jgi:tRNA U34 2-thiouridine synthase MnmA/TrmU